MKRKTRRKALIGSFVQDSHDVTADLMEDTGEKEAKDLGANKDMKRYSFVLDLLWGPADENIVDAVFQEV